MNDTRFRLKIKEYEIYMPEKYADRTFYTIWAAIVVWGLSIVPAIIMALK